MTSAEKNKVAKNTHAIILAAGLGSRLKENTTACPKCLVPVAGLPILQRMLDELVELGVAHITIVVGYLHDAIRKFVSEWQRSEERDLAVDFVRNDRYAQTGSVSSLDLALRLHASTREQRHLLLIEGDVVLAPGLLTSLLTVPAGTAATLLAPYAPELSGTFATLENGVVNAWLHESVRSADFPILQSFKTVNLTWFAHGVARVQLDAAVERVIAECGEKAPLEFAMQRLIMEGTRIVGVRTGELHWFEVDTPEDLAIANELFSSRRTAAPV